MLVSDYIKQKIQSFGFTLSEADLLDIVIIAEVSGDNEYSKENMQNISIAIAHFIPSLLVHPTSCSVSENGHSKSRSYDINGIKEYYNFLCKTYNLKNELSPSVTFIKLC